MPRVDRRQFLKLVGAGGVGAGAGFMLAESIKHPVEHLIPYAVPPEEYSPGIATWYNSVCGMCAAGCGITVRTREGRAKKIEGNPLHPVNQGRLCALGQAGLQVLYNPDRVTTPLVQTGARASDAFESATWEEGLSLVAERIRAARDNGGGVYFLSRGVRGHLAELIELFMSELGSEHLLNHDFAHPHSLYAASERLFGERDLPYYDIHNARYVISFGADYLNNWLSPVHHSLGFGHSRQGGEQPRGRFVQIEQKMSLSGAAADEWIPAQPGTEGVLALGIAHRLLAAGVYAGEDAADWRRALAAYSTNRVADQTGVPSDTITRLADEFARASPALAIGGGAAAEHTNGVDALVAVNALNYLVGNIGEAGGVVFNPPPVSGAATRRQANYQTMRDLIADARSGAIAVLIVNDTNPVFSLPRSSGFRNALSAIPTIVSLSSFMDDTTVMADVVLPSHTYLESWGDDVPEPGVGFSISAVSQPVVSPLYSTRGTGDIVLGLAAKLGLGRALPWADTKMFLRDRWRAIYERGATDAADFDTFWREVLRSGVWGENVRRDHQLTVDRSVIETIDVPPAEFAGSPDDYPFILHPFLSTTMHDGRGANLPWMQELPEPMTSVVYGSWIEMNPTTAADLGLADGDLVQVASEHGSVEVPLIVFPAIMPDVVAMPIGQGHEYLGRYARHRGANPIQILAPRLQRGSGALATAATRVSVVATGRRAPAVRTGGESRQLGRGIVRSTGDDDAGTAGHSVNLRGIPIVVKQA